MLVVEAKLKNGTLEQYHRLDEAIKTSQFVRNSCVRYWMDFVMGTKISSNYIDFCLHLAQWTMSRMHSPVLIV